jgi:hypothetical protein
VLLERGAAAGAQGDLEILVRALAGRVRLGVQAGPLGGRLGREPVLLGVGTGLRLGQRRLDGRPVRVGLRDAPLVGLVRIAQQRLGLRARPLGRGLRVGGDAGRPVVRAGEQLVTAGRLGRKTGKGFREYATS